MFTAPLDPIKLALTGKGTLVTYSRALTDNADFKQVPNISGFGFFSPWEETELTPEQQQATKP